MNEVIYEKIIEIRNTLLYSEYYRSTNKEEIKEYLLNCGFEDNKDFEEALSIIVKCNEEEKNGNDNYMRDYLKETFSKMKPEELSKLMEKFNQEGFLDKDVIASVPDVSYLLDMFEQIPELNRYMLVDEIGEEKVCAYIERNGLASSQIKQFIADRSDFNYIEEMMGYFKEEKVKTEIALLNGNPFLLQFIKEPFYRSLITKQITFEGALAPEDLIEEMYEYDEHKAKIDGMESEEEKANYISSIDNNPMKDIFLEKISNKENRDKIINSYNKEVEEDIEGINTLVQSMIKEYFEDNLGDKLSEEQKEKLKTIMNSTSVLFGDLDYGINGKAFYSDGRLIMISERHRNNKNMAIGILIHEYAHQLSNINFQITGLSQTFSIEEGMADLFGDLVVNHYINKHEEVLVDGRPIRISKPYTTRSGYDFEAAWPRTMLAGLESSGKDKEAIGEYFLGDKLKFSEMVFGKENAQNRIQDEYGSVNLDTSYEELYYSSELDYSNIDRDSIYYKRNYILPAFELQARLKGKVNIIDEFMVGNCTMAEDLSYIYFEGKEFYEVSKEDLKEYVDLIRRQKIPKHDRNSPIENVTGYPTIEISRIKKDALDKYSFEILDNIPTLFGTDQENDVDMIVEKVVNMAIEKEKEKIRNGQDIKETRRKKEALVEKYRRFFPKLNDRNTYINDFIDDFEFECENQEKGKKPSDMDIE